MLSEISLVVLLLIFCDLPPAFSQAQTVHGTRQGRQTDNSNHWTQVGLCEALHYPCLVGTVLPHPDDCRLYLQCVFPGVGVYGASNNWIVRSCSDGTWFDRNQLFCVLPTGVECAEKCDMEAASKKAKSEEKNIENGDDQDGNESPVQGYIENPEPIILEGATIPLNESHYAVALRHFRHTSSDYNTKQVANGLSDYRILSPHSLAANKEIISRALSGIRDAGLSGAHNINTGRQSNLGDQNNGHTGQQSQRFNKGTPTGRNFAQQHHGLGSGSPVDGKSAKGQFPPQRNVFSQGKNSGGDGSGGYGVPNKELLSHPQTAFMRNAPIGNQGHAQQNQHNRAQFPPQNKAFTESSHTFHGGDHMNSQNKGFRDNSGPVSRGFMHKPQNTGYVYQPNGDTSQYGPSIPRGRNAFKDTQHVNGNHGYPKIPLPQEIESVNPVHNHNQVGNSGGNAAPKESNTPSEGGQFWWEGLGIEPPTDSAPFNGNDRSWNAHQTGNNDNQFSRAYTGMQSENGNVQSNSNYGNPMGSSGHVTPYNPDFNSHRSAGRSHVNYQKKKQFTKGVNPTGNQHSLRMIANAMTNTNTGVKPGAKNIQVGIFHSNTGAPVPTHPTSPSGNRNRMRLPPPDQGSLPYMGRTSYRPPQGNDRSDSEPLVVTTILPNTHMPWDTFYKMLKKYSKGDTTDNKNTTLEKANPSLKSTETEQHVPRASAETKASASQFDIQGKSKTHPYRKDSVNAGSDGEKVTQSIENRYATSTTTKATTTKIKNRPKPSPRPKFKIISSGSNKAPEVEPQKKKTQKNPMDKLNHKQVETNHKSRAKELKPDKTTVTMEVPTSKVIESEKRTEVADLKNEGDDKPWYHYFPGLAKKIDGHSSQEKSTSSSQDEISGMTELIEKHLVSALKRDKDDDSSKDRKKGEGEAPKDEKHVLTKETNDRSHEKVIMHPAATRDGKDQRMTTRMPLSTETQSPASKSKADRIRDLYKYLRRRLRVQGYRTVLKAKILPNASKGEANSSQSRDRATEDEISTNVRESSSLPSFTPQSESPSTTPAFSILPEPVHKKEIYGNRYPKTKTNAVGLISSTTTTPDPTTLEVLSTPVTLISARWKVTKTTVSPIIMNRPNGTIIDGNVGGNDMSVSSEPTMGKNGTEENTEFISKDEFGINSGSSEAISDGSVRNNYDTETTGFKGSVIKEDVSHGELSTTDGTSKSVRDKTLSLTYGHLYLKPISNKTKESFKMIYTSDEIKERHDDENVQTTLKPQSVDPNLPTMPLSTPSDTTQDSATRQHLEHREHKKVEHKMFIPRNSSEVFEHVFPPDEDGNPSNRKYKSVESFVPSLARSSTPSILVRRMPEVHDRLAHTTPKSLIKKETKLGPTLKMSNRSRQALGGLGSEGERTTVPGSSSSESTQYSSVGVTISSVTGVTEQTVSAPAPYNITQTKDISVKEEENRELTTSIASTETGLPVGIIIGVSVVGILLLAIIAVPCIFCRIYRNHRKHLRERYLDHADLATLASYGTTDRTFSNTTMTSLASSRPTLRPPNWINKMTLFNKLQRKAVSDHCLVNLCNDIHHVSTEDLCGCHENRVCHMTGQCRAKSLDRKSRRNRHKSREHSPRMDDAVTSFGEETVFHLRRPKLIGQSMNPSVI